MRFLGWLLVFLCAAWLTSRVMRFEGFTETFEKLARTQLFEEWCLERCFLHLLVRLGRHGNAKSTNVKRNSVKRRLGFSGEAAQVWGRARVSWAGLFMCVYVLGVLSDVNQTQINPERGYLGQGCSCVWTSWVSWAT